MANNVSNCVLRTLSRTALPQQTRLATTRWANSTSPRCLLTFRTYSTEALPPPLLVKLKGDLKAAMKAKDAPRLAVLRSVFAATLNASKTSSPIKTDIQLVALLRKTIRASEDAILEARQAGRQDLEDKEQAQIKVLEEYVASSGIVQLEEAELRQIIGDALSRLGNAGNIGSLMREIRAPGGPLDGKEFDGAALTRIANELLKSK